MLKNGYYCLQIISHISCGSGRNQNGNRYMMYIKQCVKSFFKPCYSERDNSGTHIFKPQGFKNALWYKNGISIARDM